MKKRISALTILLLLSLFLPARAAEMVEDLNPGVTAFDPLRTPGAQFFSYTPVNGRAIFLGFLGSDDLREPAPECGLWTTDGTAEGTEQLAELCGEADTTQDIGRIRILGTNGSVALFTDLRGRIWRTDGTAAGTFRLGNVTNGGVGGGGQILVGPDGRTFFFAGCNRPFGCEPWKSDGTREGTAMIRDLRPGRKSSDPALFVRDRGRVLFTANAGRSLWATNGTAAGTVELAHSSLGGIDQIIPQGRQVFFTVFSQVWAVGPKPGSVRLVQALASPDWQGVRIEEAGGRVFITRTNYDGTVTLWETNGTSRGTRVLARFEDQTPLRFFALGGNRIVFGATREEGRSPELWYLDPGMKSPRRVGSPRLDWRYLIQLGDRLFFVAAVPANGASLWVTDGTREETRLVQGLCAGACETDRFLFRTALGHLFFTDGESRLWTTDESGEDPVLLSQLPPPGYDGLVDLAPLGSRRIVFSGFDDREGPQPWVSDLTPGGTDRILPLGATLAAGSRIWSLTPFGDKILFTGCDGESSGVFVSDGTAAGTFLLAGTEVPVEGPCTIFFSSEITVFGDIALFYAGGKLWRTDGTQGGTSPLLTLDVPFLRASAKLGDQPLFVLDPPDLNERVWSFWTSDGTEAGTRQAFGLRLGGTPMAFASVGGEVFFIAQSAEAPFPYTLWRTDGTEAGTRKLMAVDYPVSGLPLDAVRLGGKTILALKGSERPFVELWVTDGTAAGTVPLIADPAAPGPRNPFGLTVFQDAVWFFTGTGDPRDSLGEPFALWRSDGTAAGTRLIKTVSLPRAEYEFLPPLLTPVGDTLFFRADDGVHGSELWKTDGTTEGTVLVEDIAPGPANAHPTAFAASGGKLWFAATDGVHGLELWESDGTAAGTRLVEDIFPGPSPSAPQQLTAVPGKLFFAANDGVHGQELWLQTTPH
jgi:trimeric autotransporter adhesin